MFIKPLMQPLFRTTRRKSPSWSSLPRTPAQDHVGRGGGVSQSHVKAPHQGPQATCFFYRPCLHPLWGCHQEHPWALSEPDRLGPRHLGVATEGPAGLRPAVQAHVFPGPPRPDGPHGPPPGQGDGPEPCVLRLANRIHGPSGTWTSPVSTLTFKEPWGPRVLLRRTWGHSGRDVEPPPADTVSGPLRSPPPPTGTVSVTRRSRCGTVPPRCWGPTWFREVGRTGGRGHQRGA